MPTQEYKPYDITTDLYLDIPVMEDDIKEQAGWPNERLYPRMERMRVQHEVANGDFRSVLPDPRDRTLCVDSIGASNDAMSALLLTTDPGSNWKDPMKKIELQNMLDNCLRDGFKHGRGLMLNVDGVLTWESIRNSYPVENSEDWIIVKPFATAKSNLGKPDHLKIYYYSESASTIGMMIYKYEYITESNGIIMEMVLEGEKLLPCKLAYVDMPPTDMSWGTPFNDQLISIAAAYTEMYSHMKYTVKKNARPLTYMMAKEANMRNAAQKLDPNLQTPHGDPKTPLTPEERKELGDAIRDGDTAMLPEGITDIGVLETGGNVSPYTMLKQDLDDEWQKHTGVSHEAGDSAKVDSGVAVARRSAPAVMRMARFHSALYNTALQITDEPFDWDYIGVRLLDAAEPTEDEAGGIL